MSRITNPRAPKVPSKVVVLGLEPALFRAGAECYERRTGSKATAREVLAYAVNLHLPDLLTGLRRLGLRGGKIGKRRPRRINLAAWDALQAAAAETGVTAPALLRACLQLVAET